VKKGEWTFITNHARVLVYLAKHENATIQKIAHDTVLSIGAVDNIIKDLRNGGYVSWRKEGRRNHYTVYGNQPLRHSLERDFQLGDVLVAIGCAGVEETTNEAAMHLDKSDISLPENLVGTRR
jgi:hypothetical protein